MMESTFGKSNTLEQYLQNEGAVVAIIESKFVFVHQSKNIPKLLYKKETMAAGLEPTPLTRVVFKTTALTTRPSHRY